MESRTDSRRRWVLDIKRVNEAGCTVSGSATHGGRDLDADDLDLARFHKHAVAGLADEVGHAVDAAVVLSLGFCELDADPFPGRERGGAVEANDAATEGDLDGGARERFCGHRTRWWWWWSSGRQDLINLFTSLHDTNNGS